MARSHTYFLARKSQCEGALKDNVEVASLLAELYSQHKGEADATIVDGSSLWVDDEGAVQLRVIAGGVSQAIAPSEPVASAFLKASAS